MAQIALSSDAPQEQVRFSLGTHEFSLAPGEVLDTDEESLVSEAEVHAFLTVTHDDEAVVDEAPEPVTYDPFASGDDEEN